jgi:hypothetical protein
MQIRRLQRKLRRALIGVLALVTVLAVLPLSEPVYAEAEETAGHPPAFTYAEYDREGHELALYFDESFTIIADEASMESFLSSSISIARDGGDFLPLSGLGIQVRVGTGSSSVLTLYSQYGTPILNGMNSRIKINAGVLKDLDGHLNAEMTLDDVTPPRIESTAISSDYHEVTITFSEPIYDKSLSGGASRLGEKVYLLRNGSDSYEWEEIGEGDSVAIDGNKLILRYAESLTGSRNLIVLDNDALTDAIGNYSYDDLTTSLIAASGPEVDRTPPYRASTDLGNGGRDVIFVFNEEVTYNTDTLEILRGMIRYYQPGVTNGEIPVPDDTDIIFSGNTLTLRFQEPLFAVSQSYRSIFIPYGVIKDLAGNRSTSTIYSTLYPQSLELTTEYGGFANSGRWLMLAFSRSIADNTVADGVSQLKAKVTVSTDQGGSYAALGESDDIDIYENMLLIRFDEPVKAGSVRVRIEAEALRHPYDLIMNEAIDQVVAYNTPDFRGFFFSDAVSEFTFEDNAEWRTNVRDVLVYDDYTGAIRPLNPSDYTLTAGKLTINPGVFEQYIDYELIIQSDGYSAKSLEGEAMKSSELFYMTAPVLSKAGVITAKIDVLSFLDYYNYYYDGGPLGSAGRQSIVFELLDGTTPVSIVAADLTVRSGTYAAQFHVPDAATNPNYTVKAFIVSKFDTDVSSVGINLATVLTQAEWFKKQIELIMKYAD